MAGRTHPHEASACSYNARSCVPTCPSENVSCTAAGPCSATRVQARRSPRTFFFGCRRDMNSTVGRSATAETSGSTDSPCHGGGTTCARPSRSSASRPASSRSASVVLSILHRVLMRENGDRSFPLVVRRGVSCVAVRSGRAVPPHQHRNGEADRREGVGSPEVIDDKSRVAPCQSRREDPEGERSHPQVQKP